jgi:hypothetical protein
MRSSEGTNLPPFKVITYNPSIYARGTKLRNPEPDSLENVSWMLLRPMSVLGIQRRLTGRDVGVGGVDPVCSLEDLPEEVEDEEDWYANVCCKEVWGVTISIMLLWG